MSVRYRIYARDYMFTLGNGKRYALEVYRNGALEYASSDLNCCSERDREQALGALQRRLGESIEHIRFEEGSKYGV